MIKWLNQREYNPTSANNENIINGQDKIEAFCLQIYVKNLWGFMQLIKMNNEAFIDLKARINLHAKMIPII